MEDKERKHTIKIEMYEALYFLPPLLKNGTPWIDGNSWLIHKSFTGEVDQSII